MGDVFTSGDLQEGHNDPDHARLVHPTKAYNNTPKPALLLACGRFVHWYKCLGLRTTIWHIEKDTIVKSQ